MRSLRSWCAFTFFLGLASSFGFANFDDQKLREQIKDEYFVVLKHKPVKAQEVRTYTENKNSLRRIEKKVNLIGGKVLTKFLHAFVGLHVKMNSNNLKMLDDPAIDYIEKNGIAKLHKRNVAVKSWGIDRVDQRDLPLDNSYTPPSGGAGVHVYVVDTGIRTTHQEFTGRIGNGISVVPNDPSIEDCNVHGSHVSGTAMGSTAGIARQATVHPVRVFGCSGGASWSTIIQGIEWVAQNHQKPAVANFSLGGGKNAAVNTAVANLVKAGVTTVVSAGNNNGDACQKSPASEPTAITVAASTKTDQKASYSNWGTCVDIIAPGSAIISAGITSDTDYRSLSGTSMSSPHVTGGAALLLGSSPALTPAQVESTLVARASKNKISGFNASTPNELLYVKGHILSLPIVSAGKDQIVRFPKPIILKGTAKQKEGEIVKVYWEQVRGKRLPTFASQVASGSWTIPLVIEKAPVGTYLFMLTAEDSAGQRASDTVEVIVTDKNLPPIADAGKDKKKNPRRKYVVLDGRKSYDPDGKIVKFQWKQESGPSEITLKAANKKRAIASGFQKGAYVFSLTVTDNDGAKAMDKVMITVD